MIIIIIMECHYTLLPNKKKSIKDKSNILPHNLWSGGDYSSNINWTDLVNEEITLSSEWKCNGEYCLKFTSTEVIHKFVVDLPYTTSGDELTLKLNCLTRQQGLVLKLLQYANSSWETESCYIPKSDNVQEPSITINTSENILKIRFLIEGYDGLNKTFFIDNIRLDKR